MTLGQLGGPQVQGDDDTTAGPIFFEHLDPGHQVAGGDDQNVPNRGDDSDTVSNPVAGNPPAVGSVASTGGAEFIGAVRSGMVGSSLYLEGPFTPIAYGTGSS